MCRDEYLFFCFCIFFISFFFCRQENALQTLKWFFWVEVAIFFLPSVFLYVATSKKCSDKINCVKFGTKTHSASFWVRCEWHNSQKIVPFYTLIKFDPPRDMIFNAIFARIHFLWQIFLVDFTGIRKILHGRHSSQYSLSNDSEREFRD